MLRDSMVCIALILVGSVAWGRDALPIVVEVDHGVVTYQVAEDRGSIEHLVSTLRAKVVPDQPSLDNTDVYVVASKQASIADLQRLRAVLQKYGFLKIRFFTYWDA